jgi:hypothetical protein
MQIAIATANQRDGPCTSAASFEARFRSLAPQDDGCAFVTFLLTVVPVYVTAKMPARPRDVTGDGRLTERARFLRTELVTPFSGGSGNTPGRHYDRSARSSLDWDRLKTGNARQGRVPGSA